MVLLRLADRQGLFKGPAISRFQQWALAYLIVEERKEQSDSIYDQQEFMFSLIQPELYREKIRSRPEHDLSDGEMNITPDDFSMVEKWLKELDKPKQTNLKG
jgi:hypothetical protein